MFDLFVQSTEDYLKLVEEWNDPLESPVIEEHDSITVIREDMVNGGSKARSGDFLIQSHPEIEEWVYGSSPATGYAQVALAVLCKRHNKKAVLFMADRAKDNLTNLQERAIDEGADMRWVPNGMLTVTEKRARDYVSEKPETRMLVPIGLDHETVIASYCKIAKSINVNPKEVWTVGSSGTLTRGLQLAWPDAEFHCVCVGHKGNYGKAKTYQCEIPFNKPVKNEDLPPFPSAPTYDAKAWPFIKKYASPGALFWNVGA